MNPIPREIREREAEQIGSVEEMYGRSWMGETRRFPTIAGVTLTTSCNGIRTALLIIAKILPILLSQRKVLTLTFLVRSCAVVRI